MSVIAPYSIVRSSQIKDSYLLKRIDPRRCSNLDFSLRLIRSRNEITERKERIRGRLEGNEEFTIQILYSLNVLKMDLDTKDSQLYAGKTWSSKCRLLDINLMSISESRFCDGTEKLKPSWEALDCFLSSSFCCQKTDIAPRNPIV